MKNPDIKLIAYRKDQTEKLIKVERKAHKVESNTPKSNRVTHAKDNVRERRRCDCSGSEHPLLINCIGCGRLICSIEGEGPCFNCNNGIVTNISKLPKEHLDDPEFKKALALKDKLISAERSYMNEGMKVHNLHGGWFEDSRNLFNEDRQRAEELWKSEELKEQMDSEIKRYDLDLITGRFSMTAKN